MSKKCTCNDPISTYAFKMANEIEEHFKDIIDQNKLLQAKILAYGAKLTGIDKQKYYQFFGIISQYKGDLR